MSAPLSPSFTHFAVERCIRIFAKNCEQYAPTTSPNREFFLPVDPRQNPEILANITRPDYQHDPAVELGLVRTRVEGIEYSAVDPAGGALYEAAKAYVPHDHSCRFEPLGSYGGVFWRVVGHVFDAPASPMQIQVCSDEEAAKALCGTFQAMLEAYQATNRS
ncbi:hypothetical protein [Pseudomonas asiatica]|uniref:hypothetical protein n=1 Tax=Pseudomonas asiatica TaxID=2219225 RepID=UPI0010BF7FF6|nr:hypothetical protein [Pseudomonas asiatica]